MGRLDRYVAALFISSYLTALLVVLGLFFIMDMASNLDEYLEPWADGSTVGSSTILSFYLLNIPYLFLQSSPFITLAAGMFTAARLMRNREVAAALAAGVGTRRLFLPVLLGGLLLAVGSFVLRESMHGAYSEKRDRLHYVLTEKSHDRVYEKLWLRDLSGSVLRAGEFRPSSADGGKAVVTDLLVVMRQADVIERITADRAVHEERAGGHGWRLEGGVRKVVGEDLAEIEVEWLEGFEFTPELAMSRQRGDSNPLELSFGEVVALSERDPDDVAYQTLMQYLLTFPLANLVLLLVGLPMLMRHERGFGAEGIAYGLLLCVFFFAADFIFRNLGLQGEIDPLLASWAPILFFGSLGVVLFDSMRT